MHKTKSGFTIVELLIVIVVIGILAAITIVAYNGIQQRAHNSQTASAVKQYYQALMAYRVDHDTYPIQASACLGTGYPNDRCWQENSSAPSNTVLNNALKTYMGDNLPNPSVKMVNIGTNYNFYRGGILYQYVPSRTLDGQPSPYALSYYLQGDVKCPVGPIAGPGLTSTTPVSGRTEFFAGAEGPQCVIPLPTP